MTAFQRTTYLIAAVALFAAAPVYAEKPPDPQMGYVFPSGGKAGQSIEVDLGGADWTPDVEFLIHDPRVTFEILSPLGPTFVPQPPHLIGDRAYYPPPLPREMRARITVPPDVPAGPVRWQVANANGSSRAGVFVVGDCDEVLEAEGDSTPQAIAALPVTINGRLEANQDIDRFLFSPEHDGLVTCDVWARRVGSTFNAVVEVREDGKLVEDFADTRGLDGALTFVGKAGQIYEIAVRELDYRGHRSFVYRLQLTEGLPAGNSRPGPSPKTLDEILAAPAVIMAEFVGTSRQQQHRLSATKGQRWRVCIEAESLRSSVDAALTVIGPDGAKIAECDDVSGTTDPCLEFVAPADGEYTLDVADLSSDASPHARSYRLIVDNPRPDFRLRVPQRLNVPIGTSAELTVQAERVGGFDGPIEIAFAGLPFGVSVPGSLAIPAGASELKVALTAAADAAATAQLVQVNGQADLPDGAVVHVATGIPDGQLTPEMDRSNPITRMLIATTMKPRVRIRPVETDERTVNRGMTHLAPISIERLEGFAGDVLVQTEGTQPHKFRQGILGPDVVVPAADSRVLYPCFVPHHAETLDAYRFSQVAVAQVADPQGNVRHLLSKMETPDTSVAITVEGGLLGLKPESSSPVRCRPGEQIVIPLSIVRSPALRQPVRLELAPRQPAFDAEDSSLDPNTRRYELPLTVAANATAGQHRVTIRATAHLPSADIPTLARDAACTPMDADMLAVLASGRLPCFAETTVEIEVLDPSDVAAK